MLRALTTLTSLATLTTTASGHGAVVNPPPRNAIDKDLAPWSGPVPCHVEGTCPSVETKTGWCPVPGKDGKVSGQNGQSCFWFSNGCAVGCDACDGNSRGPIPNCGYEPSKPCKPQAHPTGTGRNKVLTGALLSRPAPRLSVCRARGPGRAPLLPRS
jgi:hypothetical protein